MRAVKITMTHKGRTETRYEELFIYTNREGPACYQPAQPAVKKSDLSILDVTDWRFVPSKFLLEEAPLSKSFPLSLSQIDMSNKYKRLGKHFVRPVRLYNTGSL